MPPSTRTLNPFPHVPRCKKLKNLLELLEIGAENILVHGANVKPASHGQASEIPEAWFEPWLLSDGEDLTFQSYNPAVFNFSHLSDLSC